MPAHNYARPAGRLVELAIDSAALRDNMLGDPHVRTVAVYLPQSYESDPKRRFPWMLDLAAFGGSGLKRLAWSAFGESVPQRVDRLIAQGRMPEVVLVFPDAFTRLGGNQYVDSPVLGRWEAFLLEELVPELLRRFRLLPGPEHRAVFGKSSGGYGALRQVMLHPGQWGAAACHSGDIGFDLVYRRDFPGTLDTLARHGGNTSAFLEEFAASPKVRGSDLHALMILAMAASYDPDPRAPLGIRLPVDPYTCQLDPAAWARWLRHDPLQWVERPESIEALRGLRELYFDCGRRDQYYLHYGARALARALRERGVPHTYEEFDDDHSSTDYRLDVSLPRLAAAIAEG